MSALTEQLTDSLAYEDCLAVAVFCLLVAERIRQGGEVPRLVRDLPREWAKAATHVLPEDVPPFRVQQMRRTVRRLV